MLRRVIRPNETKEYNVIIQRSQFGNYAVADVEDIVERDRKLVNSYLDTLMSDNELIPSNADKVLVNFRETEETLTCSVRTVS